MADTPSMVERVAQAVYDATPFKVTEGDFDAQSKTYKLMCRLLARAAIAAMREPSEEMLSAAVADTLTGPGISAFMNWPDRERSRYQAMIDAALKEYAP